VFEERFFLCGELEGALRDSEERLRTVFENAPYPILVNRVRDGSVVAVNPAFEKKTGYSASKASGKNLLELGLFVHPADYQQILDILAEKGHIRDMPLEIRIRTGEIRHILASTTSVVLHGEPNYITMTFDVTEEQQAVKALRESEEYFKAIIQNATDIIIIVDEKGRLLFVSPSVRRILGYYPEEVIGKKGIEFIVPEDLPRAINNFVNAIQTKDVIVPDSFRIRHKDGSERILEGVGKNLLNNPLVKGFIMNARDITERKRLDEALRKNVKTLQMIVNNARDVIWMLDMNHQFTFMSPAIERMLGYTVEEYLAKPHNEILLPESIDLLLNILAEELALEKEPKRDRYRSRTVETQQIHRNGSMLWVELKMNFMYDADEKPIGILGFSRDVTERKRVEEALKESEEKFRTLAESMSAGIFLIRGTKFIYNNPIVESITGFTKDELMDMNFWDVLHPDFRELVKERVFRRLRGENPPTRYEVKFMTKDGQEKWIDTSASLFELDNKPTIIGSALDITERKLAEESLERAFAEIMMLKEKAEAENIILHEEQFKDEIPGVIAVSKPIKYIMHRIQQVALTKTTVLLLGETGTGKGIFAHAIHETSDRKDKPFVKVNCAGLPPNLIESELFGREKGAFTGSTARQIGRFELANGGTIYLDEIGELPIGLQAKLLKVIEDGEFERLGSPYPVKVDVRIIASTNRQLEDDIKKGLFRKDLFYRLNVFPITIPPLRERKADIAPLVKFYVSKFSSSLGKGIKKIPRKTLEVLEDYAWHGNIRELMNVIERSVILSNGSELELTDISALSFSPDFNKISTDAKASKTEKLLDLEREHIYKILEEMGWRIEGRTGAARRLGLHPNTLRARLKKLGIKRPGIH